MEKVGLIQQKGSFAYLRRVQLHDVAIWHMNSEVKMRILFFYSRTIVTHLSLQCSNSKAATFHYTQASASQPPSGKKSVGGLM